MQTVEGHVTYMATQMAPPVKNARNARPFSPSLKPWFWSCQQITYHDRCNESVQIVYSP